MLRSSLETTELTYYIMKAIFCLYCEQLTSFITLFFLRCCPFKAQELRPSDSRMLVALGESYEKLDKIQVTTECISLFFHNFMELFSDMDMICISIKNNIKSAHIVCALPVLTSWISFFTVASLYAPIGPRLSAISKGPKKPQFPGPNPHRTCPRTGNGCCPHQKHYARRRIDHRCINSYNPCDSWIECLLLWNYVRVIKNLNVLLLTIPFFKSLADFLESPVR